MATNVARRWPLVGRDAELARIRAMLDDSEHRGVLIVGGAGAGRTRLASEALEIALAQGLSTTWASATRAAASLPFGAFAHLLPTGVLPGGENAIRTAAAHVLGDGRRARVAVGVDDAHLLDGPSAALVHHLATHSDAFVVVTERAGSIPPDAITALWKDGICERIELRPLSEGEVSTLLETVLGSRVDRVTQQRLFEQSVGNPLVIRELVVAGLASGALASDGGGWRWHGPIAPAGRLAELLDRRLAALSARARHALEILALAEPMPVALLASIAGAPAVEELELAGVVEERQDGARRYARVTEPLTATWVRAGIPPARARRLGAIHDEALGSTARRRKEDVPLASRAPKDPRTDDRRLTPREREVARLATGGLSNKQIAERLHVSVRTVDNHLHRVYRRLGLGGRGDLARTLREEPAAPTGRDRGIEHRLLRETDRHPPNGERGTAS